MRAFARSALNIIVILTLLLALAQTPAQAQEDPNQFIAKLIAQMTPEAKVGQLFLVAFPGTDTGAASDIYDLIVNYHVGGVLLSTNSGNIVNSAKTPAEVATLTNALQSRALAAANLPGQAGRRTPFIPLFVGVEQNGNGAPHSQLTGGMTPLPSPMALGATWNRDDAVAVGKVVGAELAALGINLLLGPSMDVSARQYPGDDGTNLFGGDPYWVGAMGQSYVRGVQVGSQGRVAAVLTHFPGEGYASDTGDVVDRSLEELKQVELSPYISLLQPAAGDSRALSSAMMTSDKRYRGFTGNIRQRTAPMTVDAQAMQSLMALPDLKAWRESGGVLVSAPLGSSLIRRYYSQGVTFPAQQIAQDALLAGNDILVLSDFGLSGTWPEQLTNIKNTIRYLQDKYSTDLAFQERVDKAVSAILRFKVRIYPNFDQSLVLANPANVGNVVGHARATTLLIAQDSLTLLSPSPGTLAEKPLPVPSIQDTLLIVTDDRPYRECPTCASRPLMTTDAFSQTLGRLYSTRIEPSHVVNVSARDLVSFLGGGAPEVGVALQNANWWVFNLLDADPGVSQSTALRQLVAQRPNLLANKKIIVFCFDVPYRVESDVLARTTTVYGLYGRTDPFIEVAARALLGDIRPQGNPPVNVDAIDYQVLRQTESNPNQVIKLFVGDPPKDPISTPVVPAVKVGDTLKIRTGVLVDRNGNPVPDGTQVTFTRTYSQSTELQPVVTVTKNGVAMISITLERIGRLRIRASSEPAMTSDTLELPVTDQPFIPTIVPAPTPTLAVAPFTITVTPAASPTASRTPTPPGGSIYAERPPRVGFMDFFMAVVGVVVTGITGFGFRWMRKHNGESEPALASRALQSALWNVLAGLSGYVLYGMGIPGSSWLRGELGPWAALIVAIGCGLAPLAVALLRRRIPLAWITAPQR